MDQAALQAELHYDPLTGVFTRVAARCNKVKIGDVAGSLDSHGHVQISVFGKLRLAHRLAWLYMTGEWPADEIDHKNTIRNDNRWENLREATRVQNQANCKCKNTSLTGAKNISYRKDNNKYRLRMTVGKKRLTVGHYNTIEEAQAAYILAAEKHHDEFGRIV